MKVKFNTLSEEMLHESAPSHQNLTPGNIYRVLELRNDEVRIMNDQGFPPLYPLTWFSVVDDRWPDDWVVTTDAEGGRSVSPQVFSGAYFFERYFDGDRQAVRILKGRLSEWGYTEE